MPDHETGTREQWVSARKKLIDREAELAKLNDELTQLRRELPWVPIDKEYEFETEEGTKTLAELFDGRSELLVYHLMFGPDWTGACPGCSFLADQLDGPILHLNAHDVTMVCVSHAPYEKLAAYKERMGWRFPYVSSFGSDFNFDFGVSFTEEQRRNGAEYNFQKVDFEQVREQLAGDPQVVEGAAACGIDVEEYVTSEAPGLSAFELEDGVVYHTYSSYAPDFGGYRLHYNQLRDRAPKGGNEEILIRRHDEYEETFAGNRPRGGRQ
jgi:predicted dithiol-disulfide oxidoreductase (DUF899 family)